jgi:carbon starvation protein CstA
VVLFKMKRARFAWVTLVPTTWLLCCTLTAGWQKVFSENVRVGFLAHAKKFQAAIDQGITLAPAKTMEQMHRIVFNDYVDATLAGFFMFVVLSVLVFGIRSALVARANARPSTRESAFVPTPQVA